MDYKALQKDVLVTLRGSRSQEKINKRLGFAFNQIYRWESGVTQLRWVDFVVLADLYKAKLPAALQECFSFYGDPANSAALTKHFIAKNSQVLIAAELGVSRSNISRWKSGSLMPTLHQVLALMNFASADFYRFLEMLTAGQNLPSVQQELRLERRQAEIYFEYPWLSAVLSAIGMDEYQKKPSDEFLAKKSKLSLKVVQETLAALEEAQLLYREGPKWVAKVYRNSLGISREAHKRSIRYVMSRAADGLEAANNTPEMRFSWKLFSLNQNQYEKILQRYTEFFNELGTIIDSGQEDANKIYAFSMNLVDFDFLPVEVRRDFSKKQER